MFLFGFGECVGLLLYCCDVVSVVGLVCCVFDCGVALCFACIVLVGGLRFRGYCCVCGVGLLGWFGVAVWLVYLW